MSSITNRSTKPTVSKAPKRQKADTERKRVAGRALVTSPPESVTKNKREGLTATATLTIGTPPSASTKSLPFWKKPPREATSGGLTKVATGMASEKMARWFADEALSRREEWRALSPADRVTQMLARANAVLEEYGVPPLKAIESGDLMADAIATTRRLRGIEEDGDSPKVDAVAQTSAGFSAFEWSLNYPPGYSEQEAQTDDGYARLAGTIYHEARHAEQTFRVARMLAGAGKTENEIAGELGISNGIAAKARANPLRPKDAAEWAQAQAWHANLQKDDTGTKTTDRVNQKMSETMTAFVDADAEWRLYLKNRGKPAPQDDDQIVLNPVDVQDAGDDWEVAGKPAWLTYIAARESFRQWYLLYGKMPVEEDAWAVGGQVEKILAGQAFTPEWVLKQMIGDDDDSPDPTQPLVVPAKPLTDRVEPLIGLYMAPPSERDDEGSAYNLLLQLMAFTAEEDARPPSSVSGRNPQ